MSAVEDQQFAKTISEDALLASALPRPVDPRPALRARVARVAENREVRRLVAFLFAGGVAAVFTIASTALLDRVTTWPFVLSAATGTEIGILVNFLINDRLSFRDLARNRHIVLRGLRFHVTCLIGQSVVLGLSVLLHDEWHWWSVAAQAVPIVLVTALNFTLHRFWTYRGHA